MPALASFDPSLLNRIRLHELIEFPLFAPATAEVVVVDFAGFELADGGISPIPQSHGKSFNLAAEKQMLASHRLGKLATAAGSKHRRRVADLGLNPNNVGHDDSLC